MLPGDVAGLIAARCPGWVAETVEPLGEGDFSTAYLVNGEWVFRFAKHEEAAASLSREACLLPRLADRFELRIPSPRVVSVDERPAFVAHPILPSPELMPERYLALAEPERERCAGQLARFLAQLHASDTSDARACGVETRDYRARYQGVLERARRHLFTRMSAAYRTFVEQEFAAYLSFDAPSAFQPALLHGDLSPGHVLYDPAAGCLTGVIDFGDLMIGDPAWDLVFIYEDYGLDFLSRLLPHYTSDDPRPLLRRMYSFYVLDLIEWVVRCAEEGSPELGHAVAELSRVHANRRRDFDELMAACGAA
ncbi:MAG TPA: phosphotransferase [Longimicrobium sp.]|nr:phosphotransferase [Longimicrobium sp.]